MPSVFQQIVLPYLAATRPSVPIAPVIALVPACKRHFSCTRARRRAPANTDCSSSSSSASTSSVASGPSSTGSDRAYTSTEWEYIPPIPSRSWKSGHDPPYTPSNGSITGGHGDDRLEASGIEQLLRRMEDMNATRRQTLLAAMERIASIQESQAVLQSRIQDGKVVLKEPRISDDVGKVGPASQHGDKGKGMAKVEDHSTAGPDRHGQSPDVEVEEREGRWLRGGSASALKREEIRPGVLPAVTRFNTASDSPSGSPYSMRNTTSDSLSAPPLPVGGISSTTEAQSDLEVDNSTTTSTSPIRNPTPCTSIPTAIPTYFPLTIYSLLRSRLYRLAVFHLLQTPEYAVNQRLLDDVAVVMERAGAGKLARRLLRGWDNAAWGRKAGDPSGAAACVPGAEPGTGQGQGEKENPLDSKEWDQWLGTSTSRLPPKDPPSRNPSPTPAALDHPLHLPPDAWSKSRRAALRPRLPKPTATPASPSTTATSSDLQSVPRIGNPYPYPSEDTVANLTAHYNVHLTRALLSPKKRAAAPAAFAHTPIHGRGRGNANPTNPLAPLNQILTSKSALPRPSEGLHQLRNLLMRIDKLEKHRGFRPDWVTANLVVKCWLAAGAGAGDMGMGSERKFRHQSARQDRPSPPWNATGVEAEAVEDRAQDVRREELWALFGFVKGCYERALEQRERTWAATPTQTTTARDINGGTSQSAFPRARSESDGDGDDPSLTHTDVKPEPGRVETGDSSTSGSGAAAGARLGHQVASSSMPDPSKPHKHNHASQAQAHAHAHASHPTFAYPYKSRLALSFSRHVQPFANQLKRAFRDAGDREGLSRVIGWEKEMRGRMYAGFVGWEGSEGTEGTEAAGEEGVPGEGQRSVETSHPEMENEGEEPQEEEPQTPEPLRQRA